jgi:predicted ATPase
MQDAVENRLKTSVDYGTQEGYMNLPTGIVTLLFAEVERGSAPLHAVPDSHVPVTSLRQALLYALQAQNGYILSMDDENLRAGFSTPEEALHTAVAIQQIFHPERAAIPTEARSAVRRFRVALHTDRFQVQEGQYVGEAVERITQLLSAGHSGQILVSNACAQALRDRRPADIQFRDLGKFRYSGQADGETVFQVLHSDLPADFPPLRMVGAAESNLPIPWTSFVGREAEIAELKRILADSRILTLIGSEGSGKSRLAIRLASDLLNAFPDGVWVAELPAMTDTDIVPGTVAWALNAQAGPDTSLTDALVALLRDRKALLVLDTSELNIAACARLVTALAGPCPTVKFVVCARKGLGLRDEATYCVPALISSGRKGGSEAEQFCRDRAAQFPIPLDLDGRMFTELCSLLNGIPLALELVIGGLASEPEDSGVGLTRSLRDITRGQERSWEQTLQLVLDWSYHRLSEMERLLLERLSVFQSGWSLEAATAVCCDALVPVDRLSALLESLRASAFIAAEQRAGFTRERLLDAVRTYAQARLTWRGEAAEFQGRHAEYFLQLAEQGAQGLTGPDREGWLAYLEREYVNFRVALLCLRQDAGGSAREIRLATALLPMFECSGRAADGRSLLTHAKEADRAPAVHAEDYPLARSRFFEAIDRCHTTGDRPREVRNLTSLARLALSQGDFTTAMHSYEQAIEVFRELGDQAQETRTLHSLGSAARDGGEYAVAREHYERALERNRSLGNRKDEAHNLNGLARLALMQGDNAEAARRFQEGLVLFRELGDRAWEAHNMGQILRLSLPSEPLWERSPTHDGAHK